MTGARGGVHGDVLLLSSSTLRFENMHLVTRDRVHEWLSSKTGIELGFSFSELRQGLVRHKTRFRLIGAFAVIISSQKQEETFSLKLTPKVFSKATGAFFFLD